MKSIILLTGRPSKGQPQPLAPTQQTISENLNPLPQLTTSGTPQKKSVRHILLGEPDAIRQTIHLLHTLHYTETILWSPVLTIEEPLIMTPIDTCNTTSLSLLIATENPKKARNNCNSSGVP